MMLLYVSYLFAIIIIVLCVFITLLKLSIKWDRSAVCLVGKTAIVTGANTGIGYYTAQEFAKRGAKVILACRSQSRGEDAKNKIIEATKNPNVHLKIVDFSCLKSVREFAQEVIGSEERIDILVNNAGAVLGEGSTADGLDMTMQVNYFGPFLLTILLIDLLKKSQPSRILNVSSITAHYATIDINNLNDYSNSLFSKLTLSNYPKSKLCNILFTNELARRLRGTGVTCNSVNPGLVYTEIIRNFNAVIKEVYKLLQYLSKTSEVGAQTSIYVALSKDVEYVTGEYFDNCGIGWMPKLALDIDLAKKLWDKSKEFVQLSEKETLI